MLTHLIYLPLFPITFDISELNLLTCIVYRLLLKVCKNTCVIEGIGLWRHAENISTLMHAWLHFLAIA